MFKQCQYFKVTIFLMKKSDIIYYLQVIFNTLMDIMISNFSNIFFF